jgi:nicotinamide-nucleotide amidase
MASVELVAVGTELLLGQLVDTNTAFVAQRLADAGVDVYASHAVGDNRERIVSTLRAALSRADGVVTTGGLGPTVDDLTKEAVCDALGLETELDQASLKKMEDFFTAVGRPMRENNRKQAMIPRGAQVLPNAHGTAPGFVAFDSDGKFVACMPGVPGEMKPMLTEHLIPFLRERFALSTGVTTRVLHTVNIAESEIDHRIADLFRASENPKIAVLAHGGRCDVKIMAKASSPQDAQGMIAPLQAEIERRLDGFVFGRDSETLEGAIHDLLQRHQMTVSVAESCTGGRIAAALTQTPGSSKSFVGGVVAYDNSVKISHLGVARQTLDSFGAVSEQVVCEMALGAVERLASTLAISTTGIAGPDGGTRGKPVGLVWIALAGTNGTVNARRTEFPGNRAAIQDRATNAALGMLWKYLLTWEPNVPRPT